MNIGVHESLWVAVFSRYVPKTGIAGLYGDYILSLFGHLHTVLHSGCINIDLIFFFYQIHKKEGESGDRGSVKNRGYPKLELLINNMPK